MMMLSFVFWLTACSGGMPMPPADDSTPGGTSTGIGGRAKEPIAVAPPPLVRAPATPSLVVTGARDVRLGFGPQTPLHVSLTRASYTLLASSASPVDWFGWSDAAWLETSEDSGRIVGGAEHTVGLRLTPAASALRPGSYHGSVGFLVPGQRVPDERFEVTLEVLEQGGDPMTAAARDEGVAPFAVTFDATAGASGIVQPPAGESHLGFDYFWDFGDEPSGNWASNGKPKNHSVGPVAAHVYERPGKYRIRLEVVKPGGERSEYVQQIVVKAPKKVFRGRTFHVAQDGKDSNSGSAKRPFRTMAHAIQQTFTGGQPARLLLERGSAFTCSQDLRIPGGTSVGLIGAYGSGDRPVITFTGKDVGLSLTGTSDVRVVDLEMVNGSSTAPSWAQGVRVGNFSAVMRCRLRGFGQAVSLHERTDATVYECEMLENGQYGIYAFGSTDSTSKHLAVLGCRIDGSGEHLIRTYMSRSIIQSNFFGSAFFTAMKLCGREQPNPTHTFVVSDNVLETETFGVISIGPENKTSPGQIARRYLIEGNFFHNRKPGNWCVGILGHECVVRNNIFDIQDRNAVTIESAWGTGPVPTGCKIEHNTAYRATGAPLRFCNVTSADDTVVRNNIAYCVSGGTDFNGSVATGGNVTGNPRFADPQARDFALSRNSPKRGSATFVGVWSSHNGVRRKGPTTNPGAIEER